jgi:hypothetical protein
MKIDKQRRGDKKREKRKVRGRGGVLELRVKWIRIAKYSTFAAQVNSREPSSSKSIMSPASMLQDVKPSKLPSSGCSFVL